VRTQRQAEPEPLLFNTMPGKWQLPLSLVHNQLGHRSPEALLLAHQHDIWSNITLQREPDAICSTCCISFPHKAARNSATPEGIPTKPGCMVCADIDSNPFDGHLTPSTHFKYYLLLVDAFSRFAMLLGTSTISRTSIATFLN
jgi:hypothetical protein